MEAEQWFARYSEIEKLYTLFGYTQLCNPLRYSYTPIPSYVQEGPQCGLVALAMVMQNATKESVEDLLETAKAANYTYNGEMFSAQEMCQLARTKLPDNRVELYCGNLNQKFIREFLLNSGLILVPYPCVSLKHFAFCYISLNL